MKEFSNALCRIADAIETFGHGIERLTQAVEWNSSYNQAQREFEERATVSVKTGTAEDVKNIDTAVTLKPAPERQWVKSPDIDHSPVFEKLGDEILGQVLEQPSVILPKKKNTRSKKSDDHVEDAKVYTTGNSKYPDNRFFNPEKARYNFTPQDDEEISRLFRKGLNAREISEALFGTPDKQAGVSWRITNKLHLRRPEKKRGK